MTFICTYHTSHALWRKSVHNTCISNIPCCNSISLYAFSSSIVLWTENCQFKRLHTVGAGLRFPQIIMQTCLSIKHFRYSIRTRTPSVLKSYIQHVNNLMVVFCFTRLEFVYVSINWSLPDRFTHIVSGIKIAGVYQ